MTQLAALQAYLRDLGSVLVAYSGGVDSSLLLAVAHETLGARALGVLTVAPSTPPHEVAAALAVAQQIGAAVITLERHELADPRYVANTPDRCYFCKHAICDELFAYAREHGFAAVVDGSNADDLGDYRPGARAARERGLRSPMQELGFTKAAIRALARERGLPNWDKPAAACLASRVPYGQPITAALLEQIGAAEKLLSDLGLRQYRVRHHPEIGGRGAVARIEIAPEDFATLLSHRETLVANLKELGYTYVALDLEGFRSGSMNAIL